MKSNFCDGTRLSLPGVALFLLLACGDDSGGRSSSGAQSATQNQTNPMPRDQLRDGGKFTWPLTQVPANFNYNQLDGAGQDQFWVISALMPAAYTSDAAGKPLWNRDILESEPQLITEPKQVVTYMINARAAWYDGTPITWEDFHWQWRANNGTDARYLVSSSNGYEVIESVERGKDDREAIVTFRDHFADWTSLFDQFYPASTNRDPKIFNEGWLERPLTTAGPFKFATLNQTTKTYTLVRNEKWWGEPAKLDTIVFRVMDPDAQIDALANGEIDAMDIGPDVNKLSRAKALPNIELRVAGGPNFRHITINGTSPNLQDVRVRQALAMAIDRNTIARALLGPLGIDPVSLDNHIFMANQEGYRNTSGDVGAYNPEKARQMLDSAGWTLEGNVRRKDGKDLQLNFAVPSGVATSRQEAELVQNMLGQLGVKVEINTVPINAFFSRYVTPGQFDFTVFSWMGTPYPISSAKSIYVKPRRNANDELEVLQNYARVGSDEIDQLFDQASRELDRSKAIELANRADSLIWQLVHSLTMYQRPELFATNGKLANFGAFGFARPWVYQDIGWVKED